MSAERGWISEPVKDQHPSQWHDSHYSRMADRIAARDKRAAFIAELLEQTDVPVTTRTRLEIAERYRR